MSRRETRSHHSSKKKHLVPRWCKLRIFWRSYEPSVVVPLSASSIRQDSISDRSCCGSMGRIRNRAAPRARPRARSSSSHIDEVRKTNGIRVNRASILTARMKSYPLPSDIHKSEMIISGGSCLAFSSASRGPEDVITS